MLLKIHGRIWRAAMCQIRAATDKWIADSLLRLLCCMSHALGVFELRCGRVRAECGGATNCGADNTGARTVAAAMAF